MAEVALHNPAQVFVTPSTGIQCYSCGSIFWMSLQLEIARRENHKNFYCPNGHSQYFPSETEAERLKRQLKWAKDATANANARADQAEASRRAYKGQATRLRKQVLGGQCPFCGQHLRDLERHVGRVHKDEVPEAPEA